MNAPQPRTAPMHVLRPSRVKAVKTVKAVKPKAVKSSFEFEGLKQERQRKYAGRRAGKPAAALRITHASSKKPYDGAELRPWIGRPDACAGLALPSRVGERLYYRDGRVTGLSGQIIQPTEHPA